MRILVFTGTRAEWGLLKPLVHELDKHFGVYLLVSGQHLSPTYGYTCMEIDFDLLRTLKTEILLDSDSSIGICKSIGLGVIGYAEKIQNCGPDLVIVLGDRFETFAFVQAAFTLGIEIAHIHGGEVTQGSRDNGYRNAITQLATYHFAACGKYKRRIMRMTDYKLFSGGIYNVGALGLEDLPEPIWPKTERLFLAYHPVDLPDGGLEHLENILACLQGYEVYITGANSDAHGKKINKRLREFANHSPATTHFQMNYHRDNFLKLLNGCMGIIGNSSCGLIEAPSLKVGTINVGPRQKGREKSVSVIDCPDGSVAQIQDALCKLYSKNWRNIVRYAKNPYGEKGAVKRIVEKIQELAISRN